jgi:hypothetical protein
MPRLRQDLVEEGPHQVVTLTDQYAGHSRFRYVGRNQQQP